MNTGNDAGTGVSTMTQTITVASPASFNLVQGWTRLIGAADDATDIYLTGNAVYPSDFNRPTQIAN